MERLGVLNTGNPKHADIFVVTGAVNEQSRDVIRNIYHQLPEPKVVVAVGSCASSGGIFRDCYNISGGVDSVIPVDVYVPGCAARPEAIIDGVVRALAVLEEKHEQMAAWVNRIDKTLYLRAQKSDAPEILALQKIAYQSEAELYGDDSLPALQQSLEELERDFNGHGEQGAARCGVNGSGGEPDAKRLVFTRDNCVYCTVCAKRCPTGALAVNRAQKKWTIDRLLCITCGYCVEVCPKKSLELETNYSNPAVTKDREVF